MDTRKIQYFIAVAESLSFTRAAERCFVSQTAVSQQIAAMEEEIGATLVDRSAYRIALTPAGEFFLGECRAILRHWEDATRKARAMQSGLAGVLRVGDPGPSGKKHLPKILVRFQEKHPDIDVRLFQGNFAGLADRLEAGELDVVFCIGYDIEGRKDLSYRTLSTEPVALAMSKRHPKAGLGSIAAREIAGERLITFGREFGPGNFANFVESSRLDGYEPIIAEEVPSIEHLLLLVAANKGVAFLQRSLFEEGNEDLAFLDIIETHHRSSLVAAWKKDRENEAIRDFITIARAVYADDPAS